MSAAFVVLVTGCSSGLGRALAYELFATKNSFTGAQMRHCDCLACFECILYSAVPLPRPPPPAPDFEFPAILPCTGEPLYRVFASARSLKSIAALKEDGIETVELDVTKADSISSAVAHIIETAGACPPKQRLSVICFGSNTFVRHRVCQEMCKPVYIFVPPAHRKACVQC